MKLEEMRDGSLEKFLTSFEIVTSIKRQLILEANFC